MAAPATVQLYDDLVDATGAAVANATITATLNADFATSISTSVVVESNSVPTATNTAGHWSLNLVPNTDLSPSGSTYIINTPFRTYAVTLGAIGPYRSTAAGTIVTTPPQITPTISILDSWLSPNVDLLNAAQAITGVKTFSTNPVLNAGALPESATASLVTDLAARALDSAVVHKTGAEAIAGVKTLSASPVVTSATGWTVDASGNIAAPSFTASASGPYVASAPAGGERLAGTIPAGSTTPLSQIGPAPFDGSTSGFFSGSANGTILGLNGPNGYTGRLIDAQVFGVSHFSVDGVGAATFTGLGNGVMQVAMKNAAASSYIGQEGGAGGGLLAGDTPYAMVLNQANAYPIQFGTTNVVRLTIAANGDISTPSYITTTSGMTLGSSLTINLGSQVFTQNDAYLAFKSNGHPYYLQAGPPVVPLGDQNTITLPDLTNGLAGAQSGWLLGMVTATANRLLKTVNQYGLMTDSGIDADNPQFATVRTTGLITAGTGLKVTTGNVTVGTIGPTTNTALDLNVVTSGNAFQYGLSQEVTFNSAATSGGFGIYSRVATQAAAFTMANAYGLYVESPSIGAASAITTLYGIYVRPQTGGGTNYALYTNTGAVSFGDAVTVRASGVDVTGGARLRSLAAFVASDKYLVADVNGNVHVSALGPTS